MSRVEDALKKLRSKQPLGPAPTASLASAARFPIPLAPGKKFDLGGEKHHVPPEQLVRGGLLAPLDHARSVAEEFRKIKRPLIANAKSPGAEAGANIIMIASGLPNAGKTFCSVNLAVSVSVERELNVLLVDADVAKPHISREFGFADRPGLIDLLVDEKLDVSSTLIRTDLNDIQVLPAGRSHQHATELLSSERMAQVVREIASRYPDRIVLLDSPPLLITTEAQALAGQVGQIALVVEAGTTARQTLLQTIEVLDTSKAINIILNKSLQSDGGGYYGGDYGYYGASEQA